jgi:Fe-S-cluster containining protein
MTQVDYRLVTASAQTDSLSTELMAEMAGHLEEILAIDGLEGVVQHRAIPGRAIAAFDKALAAYDCYIAHVLDAEALPVTCAAGCAACCRHELARGVTPFEIIRIYCEVRSWADIGEVYERAGESAVAFKRLLLERLEADPSPLAPDDQRILDAHLAYNRLGLPCAFLDRDRGACRIYAVRPLVCRWFFNLSPAEWCRPSHPDYLRRDCVGIDPHARIKGLLTALGERLGVRTLNYLPGAFAYVAGDLFGGAPVRLIP